MRAKKVRHEGKLFDSLTEFNRFLYLKEMEERGEIFGLLHHVQFDLLVCNTRIGYYEADFTYERRDSDGSGSFVVEDVKSPFTAKLPMYRWKVKHVFAQYGITIQEVMLKGPKKYKTWEVRPAKIPKSMKMRYE